MNTTHNRLTLNFNRSTLGYTICHKSTFWKTKSDFNPFIKIGEEAIAFKSAETIIHHPVHTGTGSGFLSRYEGFKLNGEDINLSFETYVWIEHATDNIFFEFIPLREDSTIVDYISWPGPFDFKNGSKDWYTLLPKQQGLLIPNNWKTEFKQDGFNGRFGTASAYLPFFSQIKDRAGYIAISLTPWNMGYEAIHPENADHTLVNFRLENSLGKIEYRRVMRYSFLDDCDYNDVCKFYRNFAIETGKLRTLEEKAVQNPSINDLIGSAFVHKGIKTCVQPDSDFFDPDAPDKNNHLTSFKQRIEEIKELKALGIDKTLLYQESQTCHQ